MLTAALAAQQISFATARQIKKISRRQIAKELNISGPFNIQSLAKGNDVKVIECNLRASRRLPVCIKSIEAQLYRNGYPHHAGCSISVRPDKSGFRHRPDGCEGIPVLIRPLAERRPGFGCGYEHLPVR